MLQVTLDPSFLTAITTEVRPCEISLRINDVSYSGNDISGTADTISNLLFPWKWDRPTHIRIYWLDNTNTIVNDPTDIKLRNIIQNEKDKVTIEEYYDRFILSKLVRDFNSSKDSLEGENELKVIMEKVGIPGSWNENYQEVTISDEYDEAGFLATYLAKISQELPPLNEALKMVFLGAADKINLPADGIKSYVAFPISNSENSRWRVDEISLRVNGKFVCLKYQPFQNQQIKVRCPITRLPKIVSEESLETPGLHLRDNKGDFLGHVNLQVNDIEELIPSILSAMGKFFDLPDLFINWLEKHGEKKITQLPENEFEQVITILDNTFWVLLRDSLGFGYIPESDGNSMVNRVVKKYCKDFSYPRDNDPDEMFWKQYIKIKSLIDEHQLFEKADKHYDLVKWKNLFGKGNIGGSSVVDLKWIEDNISKASSAEMEIFSLGSEVINLIENVNPLLNQDQFKEWLANWKSFINSIQKNATLQIRILFLQWKELKLTDVGLGEIAIDSLLDSIKHPISSSDKEAQNAHEMAVVNLLKKLQWYEQALLEAGEVRELQKEGILTKFRTSFTSQIEYPLNVPNLAKYAIDSLIKYVSERKGGDTINEKKKFFPELNSFSEPSLLKNIWKEFSESLGYKKNEEKKSVLQKEIEATLLETLNITYPAPPNIQIKVDTLEDKDLNDDDLNDEIAGHLVLMRRAKKDNGTQSFNDVPWKFLNWAKIKTISVDGDSCILNNSHLTPVFLPESNGNKNSFLQISNEKLSLVAGHETNEDRDTGDNKIESFDHLRYLFDTSKKAYAFWYGYQYEVAGFVALNSGVLPKEIRKEKFWNIPEVNLTEEFDHKVPYTHLRRVPVSKIRVEVKGIDGKAVLPVPKGVSPLAFEMPEWKSNQIADLERKLSSENSSKGELLKEIELLKQNDPVHYLLGYGENFKQEEINLTIRKPTTSFWNWYAWWGGEVDQTVLEPALIRDLDVRDEAKAGRIQSMKEQLHLLEPAVDNRFLVSVQSIFPQNEDNLEWKEFKWENNNYGLEDKAFSISVLLSEPNGDRWSENKLKIRPGEVIRVSFYCLIEKSCFDPSGGKFHTWMDQIISSGEVPRDKIDDALKYWLGHPQELWFEGAIRGNKKNEADRYQSLEIKDIQASLNKKLWTSLFVTQENGGETTKDKVFLKINKRQIDGNTFAYTSRAEIRHQVWHWNGRLDESALLAKALKGVEQEQESDVLNPISGITTDAMLWEAWAFSDRPDFSALVQETNLLAYRQNGSAGDGKEIQELFSDYRPGERKALYYRFSATLYSRYELLGKEYQFSIESKKPLEDRKRENDEEEADKYDKWKRYIKKYDVFGNTRLPKPSIRFIIPLTKSIQECNDSDTVSRASVLAVLDDHWFTEAGLAEQFEVGLEVVKNPNSDNKKYLNAGNDPTLTGKSLSPLQGKIAEKEDKYPYIEKGNESEMVVYEAKGPVGFTTDFAAQTPRIKGCGFIVEIPDLKNILDKPEEAGSGETNKLKAWAMVQIAVRRALRPAFCLGTDEEIKPLYSEWTAKEWVQFLPSVDDFIPKIWRKEVALNKAITIATDNEREDSGRKIKVTCGNLLPEFDPIFEDLHEKFLIVWERIYDIGGQPAERYVATYAYNKTNEIDPFFEINHPSSISSSNKIKEGNLRIMVIRKSRNGNNSKKTIWERLFGENATSRPDPRKIQDDATAALPLVSKAIPFRTESNTPN